MVANHLSNHNRGPFVLCHPDFGNWNILVDDEYNIVSIIDWGDAKVMPFEFSGVFPSDMAAMPDYFWMGGPFDNARTRQEESRRKEKQSKYVEYVKVEEMKMGIAFGLSTELGGARATLVDCFRLYHEGNQNQLVRAIDMLDNGMNRL